MTSNEEYKKRFDTHIKIDEDSGCHLWEAAKNNIGYGLFRFRKGIATTHRVIMDLEGHDIEGKMVYHICDNYNCVNPEHLRVGHIVTGKQNQIGRAHV